MKSVRVVSQSTGLEVIRSCHFPACNPLCIQRVWREVFELSWFHLYCDPKYTKTIIVIILKAYTEWCWSTHRFEEQNWCALENSKLQVKSEFTETCPRAASSATILSFQTGMSATLLNYMCLSVCAIISLQWCSRVGCNSQSFPVEFQCGQFQLSFSSGVPVYPASKHSLGRPVVSQCTLGQPVSFQCHSSVHWTTQCTLARGKE